MRKGVSLTFLVLVERGRRRRTSRGEWVPSRTTEHRVTIDSEIGVYELSVSSYCWFAKEGIFEGRFFFVEN